MYYFYFKKLEFYGEKKLMINNFIISLPFVFLLSLVVSYLIYFIGLRISPKKIQRNLGKLETYACGEDMPSRKFQISIRRFFLYVTLFLIFDISVFFLALSFNVNNIYPIIFCIIILSSLSTIIPSIGRK
jgi:NADH:ubiquinone oxidoreductase subunit 3 (subunit A)